VGPQWKVYEESPMSRTGLILRPVSAARVAHALGQNPDPGENLETMLDLGRWQPDVCVLGCVAGSDLHCVAGSDTVLWALCCGLCCGPFIQCKRNTV
jgi:hypothetical protein